MPLSGARTGEQELGPEPGGDEEDVVRPAAAAAAAHSLRLSASFFSLGIPGEEQDVRAVSGLLLVLQSAVLVVPVGSVALLSGVLIVRGTEGTVVLALSWIWSSDLGSDAAAFSLTLQESCGGLGLRKVSLLTEMNALPGVEKGRGP